MNDQYLWDRSGAPDPEIERLERTLAPLRYRHRADLFDARHTPARHWWAMAAAAAIVVAALALQMRTPLPPATAWQVDSVHGQASMGDRQAAVAMSLRAGQTVRTAGDTELTLRAEEYGTMLIGPDSELRAATDRRVELQRGLLHAYIWAPPRQFVVDTPGTPSTLAASTPSAWMPRAMACCGFRSGGWRSNTAAKRHSYPRGRPASRANGRGRASLSMKTRASRCGGRWRRSSGATRRRWAAF